LTIPATPGRQQPIAITRRPVTAQNTQFGGYLRAQLLFQLDPSRLPDRARVA
jgi:hypothetical protein